MAVFQTCKVQMRRGPELELPGAPTTLTPLVFSPGLDVAEFAFALDSGRLFVGHAPDIGQANYRRSAFPYQNIEVLTEASTDTIRKFFNFLHRDVAAGGHYTAFLAPNNDWQDVAVDRTSGAAVPFQFPGDDVIAAIEYFVVFEYTSGTSVFTDPLRQGTLRVLSISTDAVAQCTDESASIRRIDLATPAALDGDLATGNVAFRVLRDGTVGNRYHRFQYLSDLSQPVRLYFSVARPLSAAVTPFETPALPQASTPSISLDTIDVQDIVGGMVTNNTAANIQVTYDSGARKLDFSVPASRGFAPFMLRLSGDVEGAQGLDGNDQGLLVSLAPTGVQAGSYVNPNVQVDAKGRITAITSGQSTVPGLIVSTITNTNPQTFTGVTVTSPSTPPMQWDTVLATTLTTQALQRRAFTASAMVGASASGFQVVRYMRLTVNGVSMATTCQPWGDPQMGGQLTLTWADSRNDRTGPVQITLDTAYLCVQGNGAVISGYQVYNPTIRTDSYYSP